MTTLTTEKNAYGAPLREILCDYCVIDVETTGLDTKNDEIIELTALRVRRNKIQSVFTSLIKPSVPLPPYIQHLTGITDEMLFDAPSIDQTLPEFFDFVGNDPIIGHNVTFDLRFISTWKTKIFGSPFLNDYLDTLTMSRRVFPELDNHRLETLTAIFDLPRSAHRSEADCQATKALYDHIITAALDRNVACFSANQVCKIQPCDIKPTVSSFDATHPLYGKVCVFTGVLPMSRLNAMQQLVNLGGINATSVTKKTNILIVGDPDSFARSPDGKSSKQRKAEELIRGGQEILFIDKKQFIKFLTL